MTHQQDLPPSALAPQGCGRSTSCCWREKERERDWEKDRDATGEVCVRGEGRPVVESGKQLHRKVWFFVSVRDAEKQTNLEYFTTKTKCGDESMHRREKQGKGERCASPYPTRHDTRNKSVQFQFWVKDYKLEKEGKEGKEGLGRAGGGYLSFRVFPLLASCVSVRPSASTVATAGGEILGAFPHFPFENYSRHKIYFVTYRGSEAACDIRLILHSSGQIDVDGD